MRKIILAVATVLISATLVSAQPAASLRLATGGDGGTYYTMGNNLATYCGAGLQLQVQKTGGSDDNIERLTSANRADIGIVQKDILFKRSKINKDSAVANLLAVMPLHGEAMHIVVKKNSDVQKFSDLGAVTGRNLWLTTVGGKAGKKVGAYGGSIESAEIVRALSGVEYEVVPVNDVNAGLGALAKGEIDALLAMGGAPLGWVNEKLNRNEHRLIPFDINMEKVAGAYRRMNITYTKLGVNALPSIATDAVLVTRNFTSGEKIQAVSLLRKCITSELTKIQEADDTHGQWQNVDKDKLQVEGWGYFPGTPVTWPPQGGKALKR
jgi:uncharacterized protein